MTVIEHGSGGSTLWFAARVKMVISVEVNKDWYHAMLKVAPHNVEVYKSAQYVTGKKCDLLFIDGLNTDRPQWICAAHDIVKPGGIVVIDNAERPHYQRAITELMTHCQPPALVTAWTGYGKRVDTMFLRLKGGKTWI